MRYVAANTFLGNRRQRNIQLLTPDPGLCFLRCFRGTYTKRRPISAVRFVPQRRPNVRLPPCSVGHSMVRSLGGLDIVQFSCTPSEKRSFSFSSRPPRLLIWLINSLVFFVVRFPLRLRTILFAFLLYCSFGRRSLLSRWCDLDCRKSALGHSFRDRDDRRKFCPPIHSLRSCGLTREHLHRPDHGLSLCQPIVVGFSPLALAPS